MKVYYNNYNKIEPKAAGANLFYKKFSKILATKEKRHIQFVPFHIEDLLNEKLNLKKPYADC